MFKQVHNAKVYCEYDHNSNARLIDSIMFDKSE